MNELDADTLSDRAVVTVRNPESCIEALKRHDAVVIGRMIVMMKSETVPYEMIMSIELIGKYVIPEFDKTEKATSGGKAHCVRELRSVVSCRIGEVKYIIGNTNCYRSIL